MGDGLSTTTIDISLVLFCVTVIYQCGRLSARVESLESWRAEVREDFKVIRAGIEKLASRLTGTGLP
jgi:hypothetical protein